MAVFFLLVGLEIKREMILGQLSSFRKASLPVMAAIGGMLVPAGTYLIFNAGGPGQNGWGIPMATDIAFAIGALSLLGARIPKTLVTFLIALAIVDDLGAVAVIALFYTESIDLEALLYAFVFPLILVALNLGGVRRPLPYAFVGVMLWAAMLASGIHATIFFTFYGLNIIHKDFEKKLLVAPTGNPAMPMPVPQIRIPRSAVPSATTAPRSATSARSVAEATSSRAACA